MRTRVHLCGRLEVQWDGARLEDALPGRQGRLLFAFLTLHRDRPVRRDELVDALWSGEGPPPTAELLRPPLSRLRRALGEGRLEGRTELALAFPDDTWIDWEAAREALRAARAAPDPATALEQARAGLEIADRGLLPGLEAPWLDRFRAELAERRVDLLETVALNGVEAAELPDAERAARRAVEAAPFRESARLALLQVLRRRGNVAEALVAYDEFRVLLRDELGSSPGRALLDLHAELLRAERAAPAMALPDRLAQAAASPWVGREEELGRLRALAARAAEGETGVAIVTGDGGIGKTRLVAELASTLDGFDVLYGRCDEQELSPYGPWVEMLGPAFPEPAAIEASDPETERRLLFAAVTDAVRELAGRRPLVLVIDDLHWADRSSVLLCRHLGRQTGLGPVLMLGTFRDNELGPGHPLREMVADVPRDRDVLRVRLRGMDEREVAELIGARHEGEIEASTVRAIHEEAGGNPFFVEQLVRHLAEAGSGVPEGVRHVIGRRIARLPEEAGRVLRAAALIGRDFDYDLLERVAGVSEDELLDVLDAAARGGVVTEVPSTPGRYSFAHALLRTTLESELSATRRARLHARIGAAIEQLHRDHLEPWLDELARHFGEAGPQEADRAVTYAIRAADRAESRLAYDEAVRLLQRAVAIRRDANPDRVELTWLENALAAAQADAGSWEASRASYARAADAAREAGATTGFARAALGHSGGTWEQYGLRDDESMRLLQEALELLGDDDAPLRAQVLARLAVLASYADASGARSASLASEAVATAQRVGDTDALIAALVAAQYAYWRPGSAAERLPIADQLVALTEAQGSLAWAAEARVWRAVALLELCRRDDADADIARHAEIAGRLRRHHLIGHRNGLRAMRALLEGDYAAGAAAAAEVLAWGREGEMPMLLQFYGAEAIALHGERGDLGELAPYFERMVAEAPALPGWRAALAWAHVQAGRHDEARDELAALTAALPLDANYLPALAIAAHAIGELGDAELAARVEPLLAPYAGAWVVLGPGASTLGPVAYSLGVLRLVRDEPAEAAFEQALELSERMRARPYAARSRAGLAEALRRGGDGARADELSAQALIAARELGMPRLERELAVVVG